MTPAFALDELARISDYFRLEAGTPETAADWFPVTDVLSVDPDGPLDAAIENVAQRLGGTRKWIAASILFQGWAARLTSIFTGSLALGGAVPDLAAEHLSYRIHASGPIDLLASPLIGLEPEEAWRRVCADHLEPLMDAIQARVRIGRRLLRGNVASSLAGSLRTLERTGHGDLDDLLGRRWAHPDDLSGFGRWVSTAEGPRFARTTCCGIRLVPGYGRCSDCSLEWHVAPSAGSAG